jgi:hypothetical protein
MIEECPIPNNIAISALKLKTNAKTLQANIVLVGKCKHNQTSHYPHTSSDMTDLSSF